MVVVRPDDAPESASDESDSPSFEDGEDSDEFATADELELEVVESPATAVVDEGEGEDKGATEELVEDAFVIVDEASESVVSTAAPEPLASPVAHMPVEASSSEQVKEAPGMTVAPEKTTEASESKVDEAFVRDTTEEAFEDARAGSEAQLGAIPGSSASRPLKEVEKSSIPEDESPTISTDEKREATGANVHVSAQPVESEAERSAASVPIYPALPVLAEGGSTSTAPDVIDVAGVGASPPHSQSSGNAGNATGSATVKTTIPTKPTSLAASESLYETRRTPAAKAQPLVTEQPLSAGGAGVKALQGEQKFIFQCVIPLTAGVKPGSQLRLFIERFRMRLAEPVVQITAQMIEQAVRLTDNLEALELLIPCTLPIVQDLSKTLDFEYFYELYPVGQEPVAEFHTRKRTECRFRDRGRATSAEQLIVDGWVEFRDTRETSFWASSVEKRESNQRRFAMEVFATNWLRNCSSTLEDWFRICKCLTEQAIVRGTKGKDFSHQEYDVHTAYHVRRAAEYTTEKLFQPELGRLTGLFDARSQMLGVLKLFTWTMENQTFLPKLSKESTLMMVFLFSRGAELDGPDLQHALSDLNRCGQAIFQALVTQCNSVVSSKRADTVAIWANCAALFSEFRGFVIRDLKVSPLKTLQHELVDWIMLDIQSPASKVKRFPRFFSVFIQAITLDTIGLIAQAMLPIATVQQRVVLLNALYHLLDTQVHHGDKSSYTSYTRDGLSERDIASIISLTQTLCNTGTQITETQAHEERQACSKVLRALLSAYVENQPVYSTRFRASTWLVRHLLYISDQESVATILKSPFKKLISSKSQDNLQHVVKVAELYKVALHGLPEEFCKLIIKDFEHLLQMMSPLKVLELFPKMSKPHPLVEEAVSQRCVLAVSALVSKSENQRNLFSTITSWGRDASVTLTALSEVLTKGCPAFPKAGDAAMHQKNVLENALTWPLWEGFLGLADEEQSKLTAAAAKKLRGVKAVLGRTAENLKDFSVTVCSVRLLKSRPQAAGLLAACVSESRDELQALIDAANHRLSNINLVRKQVTSFLQLCSLLNEGRGIVDDQFATLTQRCKTPILSEPIMVLAPGDGLQDVWLTQGLEHAMVAELSSLIGSSFQAFWIEAGAAHRSELGMDIELAHISDVYNAAKQAWQQLRQQLQEGAVSIMAVEQRLCHYEAEEHLRRELVLLNGGPVDWVSERVQQLLTFRKSLKLANSAAALAAAIQTLEISVQGPDFQLILALARDIEALKQKAINEMTDSASHALDTLAQLTEAELSCLRNIPTIAPSQDPKESLIAFLLLDKIEDQNKFDGFRRLCNARAKSNQEVDTIAYLDKVRESVAPLLELRQRDSVTVHEVLHSCQALRTQEGLAEAMKCCCDQLPWLNQLLLTIGGDVGVNARTSLEHIIATGNVALEFAGESSATLTASDVLSLTVPATDASREKSYRLGDLRDLQSKLSLLVGAGNRQEQMAMQTFVHTVDRIEAAAEVLAQLVVSGHPKSNSLKFNAPYEQAMSCIEFEQNEWEKLLASWTETVRRLRESNRLLNLFTINQLQSIFQHASQRNILRALSGEPLPPIEPHVFQLLRIVSMKIKPSDIDVFFARQSWDEKNFLSDLAAVLLQIRCRYPSTREMKEFPEVHYSDYVVLHTPSETMFKALLTLHIQAETAPTFENTLVCESTTTEEEVRNFVLRAIVSEDSAEAAACIVPTLFTMLFIERLTHEAQQTVLDTLRAHPCWLYPGALVLLGSESCRLSENLRSRQRNDAAIYSEDLLTEFLNTTVLPPVRLVTQTLGQWSCSTCTYLNEPGSDTFSDRCDMCGSACTDADAYISTPGESYPRVLLVDAAEGQSGVGKSSLIRRFARDVAAVANLGNLVDIFQVISLHGAVTSAELVELLNDCNASGRTRIIHINLGPDVQGDLDTILFKLLVLRTVSDVHGRVVHLLPNDVLFLELANPPQHSTNCCRDFTLLGLLESIRVPSPQEHLEALKTGRDMHAKLQPIEPEVYENRHFMVACQYLDAMEKNDQDLAAVDDLLPLTPERCLEVLVQNCGVPRPTWVTLTSFWTFLGQQFLWLDACVFAQLTEELPGFRNMIARFIVRCSKDFGTTTLAQHGEVTDDALALFNPRLKWEHSLHPYVVFNNMGAEMSSTGFTFFGFSVNRDGILVLPSTSDDDMPVWQWESDGGWEFYDDASSAQIERGYQAFTANNDQHTMNLVIPGLGSLEVDFQQMQQQSNRRQRALRRQLTGAPVVNERGEPEQVLTPMLRQCLQANGVDMTFNFQSWDRELKINLLFRVVGTHLAPSDPNPAYVLTADNMKKILAIVLRLQMGLPTVIMGATGCGKTALMNFIAGLYNPFVTNLRELRLFQVLRVDGGTTPSQIIKVVQSAIEQAQFEYQDNPQTPRPVLLFIDEINACNCMGMLQDLVCERRIGNQLVIQSHLKLHIVAACNPYVRHAPQMIEKLEQAGLGFRHRSKIQVGRIPLRHLVYRVNPLPMSLQQHVFDFGRLNSDIEAQYTQSIVQRHVLDATHATLLTRCLFLSQRYMRGREDECSFVSLRDIERAIRVFQFFENIGQPLVEEANRLATRKVQAPLLSSSADFRPVLPTHVTSLVMALAVCYRARLGERAPFDDLIGEELVTQGLISNPASFALEITRVMAVFAANLVIGPNISRNLALTENTFIMIVCVQLNIPLTVIGKPGSAKSLAKVVVQDSLKGNLSSSHFFRQFKRVEYFSYLCSPHSRAEAIESIVELAKRNQQSHDTDHYAAVVVLDEVGLAEDSENLPLKVLHRLLDDADVAFVGISNWALDPAKMNRGLFLTRPTPQEDELILTARGIVSQGGAAHATMEALINSFAAAYREVYTTCQPPNRGEIIALRDFYYSCKHLNSCVVQGSGRITKEILEHCVRRNFGGADSMEKVLDVFNRHMQLESEPEDAPPTTTLELVRYSITRPEEDGRYVLLMAQGNIPLEAVYSASILDPANTTVIYGSGFERDIQEYSRVCRDVHRVRLCMETGKTVCLINCDHIMESLYDCMNKYYSEFGGQRYVEIGLGHERDKCPVDRNFRLVVIERRDHVLSSWAIPLTNRFEKFDFNLNLIMSDEQKHLQNQLQEWSESFARSGAPVSRRPVPLRQLLQLAFVGFNEAIIPTLVMKLTGAFRAMASESHDSFVIAKKLLLANASMNTLLIASSKPGPMQQEAQLVLQSLCQEDLKTAVDEMHKAQDRQLVITTFSPLITAEQARHKLAGLDMDPLAIHVLSLHEFSLEQDFARSCQAVFDSDDAKMLVLLCDARFMSANRCSPELVAFARYLIEDKLQHRKRPIAIVYLVHCSRLNQDLGLAFAPGSSLRHIDSVFEHSLLRCTLPVFQFPRDQPLSEILCQGIIDLNDLLGHCVHAALARLDYSTWATKPLHLAEPMGRIQYLKRSFANQSKLAKMIESRVVEVIAAREQAMPHEGRRWIQSVASNSSLLQAHGTMTGAIHNYIQNMATQALALVLSALDTGDSMRIFVEGKDELHELFMAIGRQNGFCPVSGDCTSLADKVPVRADSMARRNVAFPPCFPFSAAVSGVITKIRAHALRMQSLHHDSSASSTKFLSTLLSLMESSPLSEAIEDFKAPLELLQAHPQLRMLLVRDLVSMHYTPSSRETACHEHQIVYDAVVARASQLSLHLGDEEARAGFAHAAEGQHQPASHQDTHVSTPQLPELCAAFWDCEPEMVMLRAALATDPGSLHDIAEGIASDGLAHIAKVLILRCKPPMFFESPGQLRQWIGRVNKTQGVVSRILPKISLEPESLAIWNTVTAIKMFVYFVFREVIEDTPLTHFFLKGDFLCEKVLILNSAIGDANFLSREAYDNVFHSLAQSCQEITELAQTHGHYTGDIECAICTEIPAPTDAMVLHKCRHVFCRQHFDDPPLPNCPICRTPISSTATDEDDRQGYSNYELVQQSVETLQEFRERATRFSLQLVGEFSFPPGQTSARISLPVLKLLQEVVRREHPSFSDYEIVLRASPAKQSWLLRFLARLASSDDTSAPIKERANDAVKKVVTGSHDLQIAYSSMLEDRFLSQIDGSSSFEDRCAFALRLTEDDGDASKMSEMEEIASLRYAVALVVPKLVDEVKHFGPNAMTLLRRLARACENSESLQHFLFKYFARTFSFKALRSFATTNLCTDLFPWLCEKALEARVEPDSLTVCGPAYSEVRDAILKALVGKSPGDLEGINRDRLRFVLAAFVQNVPTKFDEDSRRVVIESLNQKHQLPVILLALQSSCAAEPCLHPGLARLNELSLGSQQIDAGLVSLSCHWLGALWSQYGTDTGPLAPFVRLLTGPGHGAWFLPGMPSPVEEVSVGAATKATEVWLCPNGHPYTVGDCGQHAYTMKGKCPACGAAIGGGSKGTSRAKDISLEEKNEYYCISSSVCTIPIRNHSPMVVTLLRALLQLTFLWVSAESPDVAQQVTKVPNAPEDYATFYFTHLQEQLADLAKLINGSIDDAVMLMHCVINAVANDADNRRFQSPTQCALRDDWEQALAVTINAAIANLQGQLESNREVLAKDGAVAAESMLEIAEKSTNFGPLWRFRCRMSVPHFFRSFQEQSAQDLQRYPILRIFLADQLQLRAVGHISSVFWLQQNLVRYLATHPTPQECEQRGIREFLQAEFHNEPALLAQYTAAVRDFVTAYGVVQPIFNHYVPGTLQVPANNMPVIDSETTTVDAFLPCCSTLSGKVAYGLLFALVRINNEFANKVLKTGKAGMKGVSDPISIDLVNQQQVASYDVSDLLTPILMRNCDYDVEWGKGSRVTYFFDDIEWQLTDQVLAQLRIFDEETVANAPRYAHASDMCNDHVLAGLCDRVPQQDLPLQVRDEILQELVDRQQLAAALGLVRTVMSFLSSMGRTDQESTPLRLFLSESLLVPEASNCFAVCPSARAILLCHIVALWNCLDAFRVALSFSSRIDPFPEAPEAFRAVPDEPLQQALALWVPTLVQPRLLLEVLREMLVVRFFQANNNNDGAADWLLAQTLYEHADSREIAPMTDFEGLLEVFSSQDSPAVLQMQHALEILRLLAAAAFPRYAPK